jgi:hypothetical protein
MDRAKKSMYTFGEDGRRWEENTEMYRKGVLYEDEGCIRLV